MRDIRSELYLICNLVNVGKLKFSSKSVDSVGKGGFQGFSNLLELNFKYCIFNSIFFKKLDYRRPYGCAIASLHDLGEKEKQEYIPVFTTTNEHLFPTIHECIFFIFLY